MRFVRILLATAILWFGLLPIDALAQTRYEVPEVERQVTISKADIESAMTPQEIEDLQEYNDTLERHAEYGRSFPAGSKGREGAVKIFEQTKQERDEKYAHLRGLRGQTVTAYGMPPPTGAEIVMVVMQERLFSSGSGILHPHWIRESAGGVYGSASAPTFYDEVGDGFPAGETVSANAVIAGNADGTAHTGSTSIATAQCLETAGPVPDNWDYEYSGEPVCKCFEESTVFGVTPCNWVRSKG